MERVTMEKKANFEVPQVPTPARARAGSGSGSVANARPVEREPDPEPAKEVNVSASALRSGAPSVSSKLNKSKGATQMTNSTLTTTGSGESLPMEVEGGTTLTTFASASQEAPTFAEPKQKTKAKFDHVAHALLFMTGRRHKEMERH